MNRTTTLALAVILVVSLAVMPLGAAGAITTHSEQHAQDAQETNESIAPGEQLTGVLGVQMAEVDGEITDRAYGIRIENAQTNETKAAVVSEQLDDVDERLAALEQRQEALETEREAGNITEGQYRAEVATIEAETRTAERLTNSSQLNATNIPNATLEEQGVNVSAIRTLSDRANELSGPETAEIARSIAGNSVGQSVAGDRGPGGPAGVPNDSVDGNDTDQNETHPSAGDVEGPQRGNGSDDTPPGLEDDTTGETPAERDQEAGDGDDVDTDDSDSDESQADGESTGSTAEDDSDDQPSDNDARNARPSFE